MFKSTSYTREITVLYYGIKVVFLKGFFDGYKVKKHARYGITT